MPVYKQQNSRNWLVEFVVDSHRYRRSSGTTIKRKAEALERRWRQEIHEGRFQVQTARALTLEEAASRYWEYVIVPKPSREKSKKAEAYAITVVARAFGAGRQLTSIQASDIADWRDRLVREGKSPATVNRYLATLRAILNRAKLDWNALSVVPQVRLLPLDNHKFRVISDQEETQIMQSSAPHLRNLILFLVDTGARLSEALDVTWDDIELSANHRGRVRLMRTKNGRPRVVPLTARVGEMIESLRAGRNEPGQPVFLYQPSIAHPGVPYRNPFRAWKSALRRAEVDQNLRIHDLRHTFASRLASRGVPLYDVSKLLGHQSISMSQRYAHLSPTAFDAAIQQLEERT